MRQVTSTEIKVVGFAFEDSDGTRISSAELRNNKKYRNNQEKIVTERRVQQGAQLASLIKHFEPQDAPDSFAFKASARIVNDMGTRGTELLIQKHVSGADDLKDIVLQKWMEGIHIGWHPGKVSVIALYSTRHEASPQRENRPSSDRVPANKFPCQRWLRIHVV